MVRRRNSRRSNGRSGQQVSADLAVVKLLGKEAATISGRLRCKLDQMSCGTAGPKIVLDIPGIAIKAVEDMDDIHARGHTPREVKQDVVRQINLHLARQRATPVME